MLIEECSRGDGEMMKFFKLADICWEGLTLQHVSRNEIVFPYLLFILMTLLFELFLVVLLVVTSVLIYMYDYPFNTDFFICAGILILMSFLSIAIFLTLVRRKRVAEKSEYLSF